MLIYYFKGSVGCKWQSIISFVEGVLKISYTRGQIAPILYTTERVLTILLTLVFQLILLELFKIILTNTSIFVTRNVSVFVTHIMSIRQKINNEAKRVPPNLH